MRSRFLQLAVIALVSVGLVDAARLPCCCAATSEIQTGSEPSPSDHGCCADSAPPDTESSVALPLDGRSGDGCSEGDGCGDPLSEQCSTKSKVATVNKPSGQHAAHLLAAVAISSVPLTLDVDVEGKVPSWVHSRGSPRGKHAIIVLKSSFLL